MSCTNCNKCKSSPCACADHGLETPCNYTSCSDPNAEQCEEVLCAGCVSYCGNYFQVSDPLDPTSILFSVTNGERLDMIVQKLALLILNPGCMAPADDHSPYFLSVGTVTNSSVVLAWSGVSPLTTQINAYYSDTPGVWVSAGPSVAPTVFTQTVVGLTPATSYLFKIEAQGTVVDCDSVEVEATTLL